MTTDSMENGVHNHADSDCPSEDFDVCFICLDGQNGSQQQESLVSPCTCPRKVHAACLAKWQLNCAGKDEETRCRFCHSVLPDWRPALTPQQLKPAASVMSVRYRGVTYRITYTPGPDGLEHFLATLQAIGIKVASASQVTFLCRSPDTGEEMSLKGLKAFDAAAYCASITAAKRVLKDADKRQRKLAAQQQQQHRQQHELDTSPQPDHDLGVRPEPALDSPRSSNWCNDSRRVAHVHAEAGDGSAARRGTTQAAAAAREHASRAHAAFYTAAAGSSGNLAAAGAAAAVQQQQQHAAAAASWWRRALACMHLAPQPGRQRSIA